ncbi:MAG: phosphate acyltransferase PlsX [Pseudomonadota bacterium]
MTTIVIDAMGGDHGPEPAIQAAATLSLLENSPGLCVVGDRDQLAPLLARHAHDPSRLRLQHAAQTVLMEDVPSEALQHKPDASIAIAARVVAEGGGDALVSAGNTGAVLLAASRHLGRLDGVRRAALAAVYPTETRRGEKQDPFSLLLDVGATLDATADELVTFAVMGSAYASLISSNPRPRVALLSNGSEAHKGTQAIVEAHRRLRQHPGIHFIGNVEGVDIPRGTADVVVTGGFVGNVVLKMLEGVSETVVGLARFAYRRRLSWKVALWMLSSGIRELKSFTDWQQYGGAPILGLDRLCIKAHGRSSPRALQNAIKLAAKATRNDLVQAIRRGLGEVPPGPSLPEA